MRAKNTKEKGTIEYLVYPDGDQFVGVCLTFDIVEEGKDPTQLMESIKEAAKLHLEIVQREDMSDDLLNRFAPEEYWDLYFDALKEEGDEDISSFFQRNPYTMVVSACTP